MCNRASISFWNDALSVNILGIFLIATLEFVRRSLATNTVEKAPSPRGSFHDTSYLALRFRIGPECSSRRRSVDLRWRLSFDLIGGIGVGLDDGSHRHTNG